MGIEFNEENAMMNQAYQQQVQQANSSAFGRFLVARGIAKDDTQANMFLLGIALGAVTLTIVVVFTFIL
jgi:hypothetical protein